LVNVSVIMLLPPPDEPLQALIDAINK